MSGFKAFDAMDFAMFEPVLVPTGPDEWTAGTIIGRAEHRDSAPLYQVEFQAADGLTVGGYFEAELRAADTPAPKRPRKPTS